MPIKQSRLPGGYTGTDYVFDPGAGSVLFDNLNTTGFWTFQVGTDTAATGFLILDDTGNTLFSALGDGTVIIALDGTTDAVFVVNSDALAGVEDGTKLRLRDGDGGTEVIFGDLSLDASADLIYFQLGGGAAGTTEKSPTLVVGAPGTTTADMDSTIRLEGAMSDTTNRTSTIVHLGQERRLTITANNELRLGDNTTEIISTAGVVTETGMVSATLTPSGLLSLLGGANSGFGISGNAAGNLVATFQSVNAGAGEGQTAISADDQLTLADGTVTVTYDAGIISEIGAVSYAMTPSGAVDVRGGANSNFGINGNDVGTLVATFGSVNAGAGEGQTTISADDQITLNDGTATFLMNGGAASETGMTSFIITPSAGIQMQGGEASIFGISGSAVGALVATFGSINAGAGEGQTVISADDQLSMTDGVVTVIYDAGLVTETGMVSYTITPSGAVDLRGGANSALGINGNDAGTLVATFGSVNAGAGEGQAVLSADDQVSISDGTATILYDAGVISETGAVSYSMTPSGTITLTAGAASTWSSTAALNFTTADSATWQLSGNAAGTLTLAIDSVNAGAGEGRVTINADDQIDISDGTATLVMDAGAWSTTSLTSLSVTPTAALTLTPAASSTWSLSGSDGGALALTIDAINAGGGAGNLVLNADDGIVLGGADNPTVDYDGSGSISHSGNPARNTGTGTTTAPGAYNHTARVTTTEGVAAGTARVTGGMAFEAQNGSNLTSAGGAPDAETVFNLGAYTIPADTINDGTVLKLFCHVLVSDGAAAASLTLRCRIGGVGGTLIVAGASINPADNDYAFFLVELHGTEASGAATTVNCFGKLRDTAAAGADGSLSLYTAAGGLATNGALDLVITGQWTGGAGDDANITMISVPAWK